MWSAWHNECYYYWYLGQLEPLVLILYLKRASLEKCKQENKQASKNITKNIEIENKLTVTRREEKGNNRGKKGKGHQYKGPMGKAKGGKDWGWEVVVGGAGEWGDGKMETTVLEQHKKRSIQTNVILNSLLHFNFDIFPESLFSLP